MGAERIGAHPCPYCGAQNDAVTGLAGARDPGPGDWSLCVYCLQPAVFEAVLGTLRSRKPTDAEYAEAAADPKMAQALMTAADVRARGGR